MAMPQGSALQRGDFWAGVESLGTQGRPRAPALVELDRQTGFTTRGQRKQPRYGDADGFVLVENDLGGGMQHKRNTSPNAVSLPKK